MRSSKPAHVGRFNPVRGRLQTSPTSPKRPDLGCFICRACDDDTGRFNGISGRFAGISKRPEMFKHAWNPLLASVVLGMP
jgi:hypothetical protein